MSEPFPDPRELLRRYGLAAKKSWGQNFLVSQRVYRAIVDATVAADDDWIVEIGAGLGTLTMRLAQRIPEGMLLAIERDRDMVRVLEAELGHLDNVEIIEANALKYDLVAAARWHGDPIAVCGNLPYQISSQILFHILEARQHVSRAVVMLQREVADRLLAKPSTKAYGALGVLVQTYADVTSVVRASPGAFVPAPEVESTVVKLVPKPPPEAAQRDPHHYAAVVHAAFRQRRKTLRNAIRAGFGEAADPALERAGIAPERRGETLSIGEFAALSDALADEAAPSAG
jgi:16S rRNA (adenine1518-N6/adenine1519-N6)-dimethyltransferase